MNRIRRRAWIMLVFMTILLGGVGFFLYEYTTRGVEWATFRGSPHVYPDAHMAAGLVKDREGILLLDTTDGRTYSDNSAIRQAMLHWLGDREGYIRTPALSEYTAAMAYYDPVTGVYHTGESPGIMELTLSARVQTAALDALDGRKGTVAVYNYRTGQVLCAVSTPVYDPDNVPDIAADAGGIWEGVYLNRFTQVTYPPGSIFKIVTTAAALDCVEGVQEMVFQCGGIYEIQGSRVTCEQAHGQMNLRTAFARSCNCSFAQLAQLIGSERLVAYVQKFGIQDSLSFDGITTASGNFDLAGADKVALAWSAIGQYTDMINPCQYMAFMGQIAGVGKGAVPYLVERVSAGGETTYQAQTKQQESALSPELAQILGEYMGNNVQTVYGSQHFPGLTVCAKSGTSELGGGKKPNAMFSGFVKDEKYPLAFIVVVENGGYGAQTCVPILSRVLAECKSVLDNQ